jgi:pimeloyl-ACP methyl ester carboxylesterase
MLHYTQSGTGPAVVLLHAFPMDCTLWSAQRKALAAGGFRVISPDLPGFGGSAAASGPPSVDSMADEVDALMADLGIESAVIGGLSMGGYVAMALLRRHPERLTGLILADTKGGADGPEAAANREAVAQSVLASGSTAELAEAMLPSLLGATTVAQRPHVVETVRRWIRAQPATAVAWAQRAMAARPDSLADIMAFGGPVLVLYGAQDVISPEPEAEQLAQSARAGGSATTVVQIPAAGHLTAVEDPERVSSALLTWLRALG